MNLTQKDLAILAMSNPALKARYPELFQDAVSKYRNTKVYIYENGYVSEGQKRPELGKPQMIFDSIKEYCRWGELKLQMKAGIIQDLERQVKLIVQQEGKYHKEHIREIAYKADFKYTVNGQTVIEDVKPFDKRTNRYKLTEGFKLKWKILKMKFPEARFEIY